MALKVQSPKLSFWERIYVAEVFRGLGVTLKHLAKNTVQQDAMPTYQYPEEKKPLAVRHRSRHRLTVRENGAPKCVACMCCETACPAHCIHIVAEESDEVWIEKRAKIFEIDLLRCVFCGYCVEACPEDAIRMDTDEVVLVGERREDFIVDREFLMRGQGEEWKQGRPAEGPSPRQGEIEAPPATPSDDEGWEAGAPRTPIKIPAGWRTPSKEV